MDDASRLARLAEHAATEVRDGMRLGLGSGSTAEAFIRALGKRVDQGLRVVGVPTSLRTMKLAEELGIPTTTLTETPKLDLGVDGADEIDPALDLVKGRGGALLYEKLVALACERYLIVAASEKLVERLGTRIRLPVEIVPFAWEQTARHVEQLGCSPRLRKLEGGGLFVSDGGHYILDCQMNGPIASAPKLAAELKSLTGVVDHGLFIGLANEAMVAEQDGEIRRLRRPIASAAS
jgi:ribose 5-phosphate isomerase A